MKKSLILAALAVALCANVSPVFADAFSDCLTECAATATIDENGYYTDCHLVCVEQTSGESGDDLLPPVPSPFPFPGDF